MVWDPKTGRWEGNEATLHDFDSIPSVGAGSSRPALITHYPPSLLRTASPALPQAAATLRIVGDMKFDPERMCWLSVFPEDEADPFEGMADDEEDDPGATITKASARKFVSVGQSHNDNQQQQPGGNGWLGSSAGSSRFASESSASIMSWEERTRVDNLERVPDGLWEECKAAEERHRQEMKEWGVGGAGGGGKGERGGGGQKVESERDKRERERREEKRLWEIRVLATRS